MKLKSIHIFGFKSFAERVLIQYHNGITGVIGPNGSGKSNIIDAVRWVMGEQTAKSLRADDPTDIIFSGSQNRKPISMAEVTLTFSNDGRHCPPEYLHLPEISIGRRIYRSGEREYFINKEPCRLKDIVEFLLAIGLGSKSYAIIQQDKRDRIIQASPEDLREIIEETAGITVFKVRRKEAEKRLESTGERLKNLVEIETELSRQNETLIEQVEKATLKIQYTSELKEKEISLIKNHVGYYTGIANKVRSEIQSRSHEIQESALAASQWEVSANDLKSEQLELVQQIKGTENQLDDQKIQLTKFQERADQYHKRHGDRIEQRDKLTKELSEEKLNSNREEERQNLYLDATTSAEKELKSLDSILESQQNRLDEIDESMQVEKVRLEELRSELRAIENTRATLRIRNESTLDSIAKYNVQNQKLEANLKELQDAKAHVAADRNAISKQLGAISSGLDQVVGEKASLDGELKALEAQLGMALEDRDSAKERYLEVTSHAASIQKLIDSNTGLSDGIVSLKEKLSSKFSGFLFDVVTLRAQDEKILELAIPELFQSALVEDSHKFVDIIDKAEELSLSKISLLVKDAIVPLTPQEVELKQNLLNFSKGIRCAAESIESLSWESARHVFERIFICQDEWIMLKAFKSCSLKGNNFIFVTERGVLLNGAREIAFGRPAENALDLGILQRKREQTEILSKKSQLQSLLAQSEGSLYQLNDKKKKLEASLLELENILAREKVESLKLTAQLNQFDLQLTHFEENLNRLNEERKAISRGIQENTEVFAQNQTNLDKLDKEYGELNRTLEDLEITFEDKKEMRDEINSQIVSKKSDRAVTSERMVNNRRNYEEVCFQLKRLQTKVETIIAQLEELKASIMNSEGEFSQLNFEIESIKKTIKLHEEKLDTLVQDEAEISEELRVYEQKLKSQKDHQSAKQKFITEKQLELARCETVLETALKDAWEKYQLKPTDLPIEGENDAHTRLALEARIKELSSAINGLGPVNERAVEEFKEVQERLNFLVTQKQDIERSVQELYTSIHEIEETTKGRFKEMYEKVNTEFQKIFPVLFPGGHGELHLLNSEDLLNTGVEILVRLPGKKMQNMSLFSGGEKALTAISLIFSLLKTTPAPFCFLDEVDAPLDEANVGRFNDVLEALSSEFQFVVITHNRRTMEILDTIYGISMGEPGVSKLVSVDLSEVPSHLRKKQKAAVRAGATAAPLNSVPEMLTD